MGSTQTLSPPTKVGRDRILGSDRAFGIGTVTALTAAALAIHGYHPYAEDGGLYMAGVKRLLRPELYPRWSEFVTEHLRFSLFAPLIANLVRALHLPLMTVWLLLYVSSFWLTLFAAWLLATRCFSTRDARCGAVALLATWITIPVAGTSLMLMDPYLSARSLSTPCSLFALTALVDCIRPQSNVSRIRIQAITLTFAAMIFAGLMHPLMAAYALGFILLLCCQLIERREARVGCTIGLSVLALFVAAGVYSAARPEGHAYQHVALTRTYWFIARWHWYELFGLVAPVTILAFLGLRYQKPPQLAIRALNRTAALTGAIAICIAIIFARANASTYLVARLQPLRSFQIIYIVMILSLGAELGNRLLCRKPARWVITFMLLAVIMIFAERQTFPRSSHFEFPWNQSSNGWQKAFTWISANTPVDALFALDAHYVTQPGEDAQTFRAIAERSALPDYSKDGGEASITPGLTTDWATGQAAQTGLNAATDTTRINLLRPLGVTWVVLSHAADTGFQCDYSDDDVKVCRLPTPQ